MEKAGTRKARSHQKQSTMNDDVYPPGFGPDSPAATLPDAVPPPPPAPPELWAIVSQMGHVTFAGRVTEEQRFGGVLGRCDVPQPDGTFVSRYFTAQSLYSFVPCTEEAARIRAGATVPAPLLLNAPDLPGRCVECNAPLRVPGEGHCGDCLGF